MNSIFTKIRDKHALWYKGIVFVVCIVFCTYLLPKQSEWQTSQLRAGSIWKNDDLVSKIDFLIKKTDAELALEHYNNTLKSTPYFKKNANAATELHDKIKANFLSLSWPNETVL